MTTRGYIALARGVLDHPIVGPTKPFDYFEAWTWLLLEAAWKERRVRGTNGWTVSAIPLKRGQLSYSQSYLAKAWGWSQKRVRTFLHRLEKEGMIALQTDQLQTVITIINYDHYQTSTKTKGQQTGTQVGSRRTRKGPETEEGKKERNNKKQPVGDFDSWYAAYPKKQARKAAEREYNKVIASGEITADDLLARTVAYTASVKDWPADRRRFIPHPANWLNSGRYSDEPDAAPAMAGPPKIEAPTCDPTTFTEDDWRDCLAEYQQSGSWPDGFWGPAPGEPGCLVPPALIVQPVTAPTHDERMAESQG